MMIMIFLAGMPLAWVVLCGLMYHDLQAIWLKPPSMLDIAKKRQRHHLIVSGFFASGMVIAWPLTLPLVWWMVDYGRYGVFSQRGISNARMGR